MSERQQAREWEADVTDLRKVQRLHGVQDHNVQTLPLTPAMRAALETDIRENRRNAFLGTLAVLGGFDAIAIVPVVIKLGATLDALITMGLLVVLTGLVALMRCWLLLRRGAESRADLAAGTYFRVDGPITIGKNVWGSKYRNYRVRTRNGPIDTHEDVASAIPESGRAIIEYTERRGFVFTVQTDDGRSVYQAPNYRP